MKTLLKWLVLTPVAVVLLIFALVNRQNVTVIFDPLGNNPPTYSVTAPLFAILFVAVMIGVIAGGIATWFAQGRHRRAARHARAEAERLRGEKERLAADLRGKGAALPALGGADRMNAA